MSSSLDEHMTRALTWMAAGALLMILGELLRAGDDNLADLGDE